MPNFKGIYSRDSKDHIHRTGSCIINLDLELVLEHIGWQLM